MTRDFTELDALLCAGYEQEEALYERALALTREPREATWLPELLTLFEQIAVVEVRLGPARRELPPEARRSERLKGCLDRIGSLIRALQEAVDQAAHQVSGHRQTLLPQLDGVLRVERMRKAYGRTGTPRSDDGVLS